MGYVSENFSIPLLCPHCGLENKQRLTRIRLDQEMRFRCPGCQSDVLIDPAGLKALHKGIAALEKGIAKLNRSLN
jgi:hypothetical protein